MCVSTAPGVCVCVSTAPCVCVCVCVCVHCSRCVCAWMGQIQRTHFTADYTLYNCVKKKKKTCLNIGKNIGKPIYRSISKTITAKAL